MSPFVRPLHRPFNLPLVLHIHAYRGYQLYLLPSPAHPRPPVQTTVLKLYCPGVHPSAHIVRPIISSSVQPMCRPNTIQSYSSTVLSPVRISFTRLLYPTDPTCPAVLKLYGFTVLLFQRPTVPTVLSSFNLWSYCPPVRFYVCSFVRPDHPSVRLPIRPSIPSGCSVVPAWSFGSCPVQLANVADILFGKKSPAICCHLANKIVAFHSVTRCRNAIQFIILQALVAGSVHSLLPIVL